MCCVQMYIETWVCVCVLLIRQRRGQLFLIRGSIATVITHGWAALTGLFLSVKDELDSRPDNQCTSDPLSPFYCNIVTHRRHQVLSGFGYLWSTFNSV